MANENNPNPNNNSQTAAQLADSSAVFNLSQCLCGAQLVRNIVSGRLMHQWPECGIVPIRFVLGSAIDLEQLRDDEATTAHPPNGWVIWRKIGGAK